MFLLHARILKFWFMLMTSSIAKYHCWLHDVWVSVESLSPCYFLNPLPKWYSVAIEKVPYELRNLIFEVVFK